MIRFQFINLNTMLLRGIILFSLLDLIQNTEGSKINATKGPKEVLPHKYPFIVTISKRSSKRPICSGTLISNRFVVTAAHCLVNPNSEIKYKSQLQEDGFLHPNISRKYEVGNAVHKILYPHALISAESIQLHPNYKIREYDYDIALVKLSVGVELSDTIRPMCLRDMPINHVFITGTTVGFGVLRKGIAANALMESVVPIWSNSDCNNTYAPWKSITPKQICVGGKGSDTCFVNSGSPLFATFDRKYYFLGFALYGDFHCGIKKPVVYLRIPSFIDWIKENTNYSGEKCADPEIKNL